MLRITSISPFVSFAAAVAGAFSVAAPVLANDAYGDNHSESSAYLLSSNGCLSDGAGEAALSGQSDYFHIDVSAGQQRLQLSLSGDVSAELSADAVIMGSDDDLDSPQPGRSIDQELEAGRYIVAVAGSGSYDLCVNTIASTTPRDDAFELNNDSSNATRLQSQAVFQSAIDGEFGRQLDDDWYQLTVNESAGELAVVLRVSAYEANPTLQLFDNSGNELAHSANSDPATQQVAVRATVAAGVYFAKVSGDNSATTYDLCYGSVAENQALSCGNELFRTPNNLSPEADARASSGSSGGGALTWMLGLLAMAGLRFTRKR